MSLLDQLNDVGEFAPPWKPRDADAPKQVIGKLTEIGQSTDFNGNPYLIYTLKQDNGGRIAVHAFYDVLRQELGKYKLKIGAEVGVKYLGQPEGKRYHRFAVVSDAEINLDPGTVPGDVAAAIQSDLETPGFKPQEDFRPQSTQPDGSEDPVPF